MTEGRAEVEILGQRLHVRGQGTPEYIRGLANYLNDRAQAVREQARIFDPLRLSLLAGLHIADELHRERAAEGQRADRVDRLVAQLASALEDPRGLDVPRGKPAK